jgi:pseudouridine kinase
VPTDPRVLVVGGAVLDQKVRTRGVPVLGTSNPGVATTAIGGVGRNIAENLARLGTPVALVAPVGDDPAGEAVLHRTTTAGVDCRSVVRSPHPTGTYTAVLGPDGDLVVAVSDMRATDELVVTDLEGVRGRVADAGALVLDANLPADVLGWLLDLAAGTGVSVVLEPVSVAKASRLAGLLGTARPVHLLTPNVDELAALLGRPVTDTTGDVVAAAAALHAQGVAHVWVRRGSSGSILSVGPGGRQAAAHAIGAPAVEVVDVTGAGDASTAGCVHALLASGGVVEAARFGQVCAALTCASAETVRPDLTAALVAARLTPADPPVEELTR